MGRPKKIDGVRQAVSIRLTQETMEWWAKQANQKSQSVRLTIQEALESRAKKG